MKNEDCAVLISSCDKNESLLKIFFDCWTNNWEDCPFEVFLGMEKSNIPFPNVSTILSDKESWGARFLDYLQQIKTEYILVILDDFILESSADTTRILYYLNLLKQNKNIVNIAFAEIYDSKNQITEFEYLCKRAAKRPYLINLQVGIWRKSFLEKVVKEVYSPWQVEEFGSIYARRFKNAIFLCLDSDDNSPYRYGRGWLVVRGAWNGNEIKRLRLEENYAEELFDGKDILYSNLMRIGLLKRIERRLNIIVRQLLSNINIYI